jgi:hypothetical protein
MDPLPPPLAFFCLLFSRWVNRQQQAVIDHLFEPFQQGADATGLGLYLSRALLRSFRGDLRYDPTVPGCSFVIELMVVQPASEHAGHAGNPGKAGHIHSDGAHPLVVS